jgi:hypothetical protein
MEKEVIRFTVQQIHGLTDTGQMIVGIAKDADFHARFLPEPVQQCPG